MGALTLPLLFALPPGADAAQAVLRVKARLREGASKNTTLVGWVDAGTVAEVIEVRSGWRRVQLPDGRSGFIWGDHFVAEAAEPPPTPVRVAEAAPPPPAAQPAGPDDLRAIRADLEALRSRPEPATAAALEQLRGEVARLAAAQEEFARRLDGRGPPPAEGPLPPIEGTAGAAALFLVVGGLIGWIAGRLMHRWRDRRSRIRI